jgi:hypothetical protein
VWFAWYLDCGRSVHNGDLPGFVCELATIRRRWVGCDRQTSDAKRHGLKREAADPPAGGCGCWFESFGCVGFFFFPAALGCRVGSVGYVSVVCVCCVCLCVKEEISRFRRHRRYRRGVVEF